jgi:hypothetical protein
MYIGVVGLIYHTLLAATWNPSGTLFNNHIRTPLPVASVLDWLLFVPAGGCADRPRGKWLAYLAIYGV